MITAILPKTNGCRVRVEVEVDGQYTASFWAHHFEVQLEPALNQFQVWLMDELDLTQGWIWADIIQQANK